MPGAVRPGLFFLMAGRWFQAHTRGRTVELDHLIILACTAIVVLFSAGVWALNQRGAKRLQKRIDELEPR